MVASRQKTIAAVLHSRIFVTDSTFVGIRVLRLTRRRRNNMSEAAIISIATTATLKKDANGARKLRYFLSRRRLSSTGACPATGLSFEHEDGLGSSNTTIKLYVQTVCRRRKADGAILNKRAQWPCRMGHQVSAPFESTLRCCVWDRLLGQISKL